MPTPVFYETVYDIFLPANDSDSIDRALGVLNDYAQGALLLPEEVERERGVILAEKRERDSVSYRTFKASMAFEMPGSMLPQRFPIGTDEVLEKNGSNPVEIFLRHLVSARKYGGGHGGGF